MWRLGSTGATWKSQGIRVSKGDAKVTRDQKTGRSADKATKRAATRLPMSAETTGSSLPRLRIPAHDGPPAPLRAFHPSKRLGQNFLVDKRVIERIIAVLAPQPNE